MADYDESITNLRNFIGVLLEVKPKVQQTTADIQEQAEDLDRLEDRAGDQLEAFDDALDAFDRELAEGSQEALGQLDKVADEGQDIGGQRLDEAARDVDGAEGEFENVLQVSRDDLDKDATGLSEGGFQLLSSTLTTVQDEVDGSRQEAEGAFQGFDGVVQGFQAQAETTFDSGGQEIDTAIADLADEGTEVAGQAAQCEQGFQDGARGLEAECTSVEDGLDAAYQSQMEKVETAGQDLIDSVDTLGEDTAGYVATSSADQVDAPVGLVIGDAVPPLVSELAELATMLGEAEQTTSEVDPLTIDLEKSLRVVATIDELLKAMG